VVLERGHQSVGVSLLLLGARLGDGRGDESAWRDRELRLGLGALLGAGVGSWSDWLGFVGYGFMFQGVRDGLEGLGC